MVFPVKMQNAQILDQNLTWSSEGASTSWEASRRVRGRTMGLGVPGRGGPSQDCGVRAWAGDLRDYCDYVTIATIVTIYCHHRSLLCLCGDFFDWQHRQRMTIIISISFWGGADLFPPYPHAYWWKSQLLKLLMMLNQQPDKNHASFCQIPQRQENCP